LNGEIKAWGIHPYLRKALEGHKEETGLVLCLHASHYFSPDEEDQSHQVSNPNMADSGHGMDHHPKAQNEPQNGAEDAGNSLVNCAVLIIQLF